jgi:hypothetical protein
MPTLSPQQFVKKWSQIQLKERTIAQSHFNDICALVGHKTPLEIDPKGEFFTFEAQADKVGGKLGWADAWYKGHFVWEYKGLDGANLDAAYQQLLLYKDSLGNPPLLITSDTQDIFIHTNFTNTVKRVHKVTFDTLLDGSGLDLLKRAFNDPESFKPSETQEQVTRATAERFNRVANTLQAWAKAEGVRIDPEQLAHFIVRLLFCLFAEDIKLLPANVFTSLVKQSYADMRQFEQSLRLLFAAMREGGMFGFEIIPHFNGGLFDSDYVPGNIPTHVLREVQEELRAAAPQDWSAIDPSIFGTLFERIIDESKRAQLGAHYTGKDDILLVIEPVLMQPLREKWQNIKLALPPLPLGEGRGEGALRAFSDEIASLRVLDPACGSGNFLYLALRQLLDLQKEVITFAAAHGVDGLELTVSPQQLYGIEKNPYAHELAQVTVWIGYLQWRAENGFATLDEPILKPLKQIENKDAILDLARPDRSLQAPRQVETHDHASKPPDEHLDGDLSGLGREPTWPAADVIVGNPPFLGGNRIRAELGDEYVDTLFEVYKGRVPAFSDLVCYWFEKARAMVEAGQLKRAGLLATQGIRGGVNRNVLERIKETGDIFWAYSDRKWILDGAMVHVSMVGFDNGQKQTKILDDLVVATINPDLTATANLTEAQVITENINICFMGPSAKAPFDIEKSIAQKMLLAKNSNGKPNSDVVRPVASAIDIGQGSRGKWTIDFALMDQREAAGYEMPFEYVRENVYPIRSQNRRTSYAEKWWQYAEARPGMRAALKGKSRFISTPGVSKHRLFVWMDATVLCNQGTLVFAREDDYFFGILHSTIHELWARGTGTQLREAESGFRYTSTSTFETFPFPWPPGREPENDARVQAIGTAAKQLDGFRNGWLHPPESEIGVTISEKMLQKRTLTNLYNMLTFYREQFKGKSRQPAAWNEAAQHIISISEIETLDHIHTMLDHAVLNAYGWPHNLSEEGILERLLALNLERAKGLPKI